MKTSKVQFCGYNVLVAICISSLGGCGEDCRELSTVEGERIVVTVTKVKRECSSFPLTVGEYFVLDMEKVYEVDTVDCPFRSVYLSRIANSYVGVLDNCETGSVFARVGCIGDISENECQAAAHITFPPAPDRGVLSNNGVLRVDWDSPCSQTKCQEGARDQYEVRTERVGMGWLPASN
jgi:hypothetical protein